ncbi:MAG TPA: CBS domain-containing protein [Candidatus Marinimicrobia bacterium]|nr:MAG: hypothetical protein AUJ47_01940 [Candidatus Marinimicrobia bacterium CG1_02_48_14]PIZ63499.1 MAG: CBS domain-containing protein [Candidatus Marinimicrobia bacterium CG_4_10_14_0_2_um_filter_48_9]PJA52872.1 MAG: CBS domain-containing protein [Candidatus Marinimicrobia bacterium CG_4_9_14_3_um_filter_48_9]HCW75728.1 CBS domain-containing protein [Candidatus Neomarinimicrobiota bacterium]
MSKISVRDFMTKKVITFKPDTPIYTAINTLVKNEISGASVVDEKGRLVGIVSEKDCLRILANGVFHNQPGGKVEDYMTDVVVSIQADTDIFTVADLFLKNIYRRMPVVEEGRVIGQVSRRDVLRAIQEITDRQSSDTY